MVGLEFGLVSTAKSTTLFPHQNDRASRRPSTYTAILPAIDARADTATYRNNGYSSLYISLPTTSIIIAIA
jgi:hypothetical protein